MSLDVKALADRLAAVERLAASLRSGRDGRDGRDGLDAEPAPAAERGERGEAGLDGRDGLNGKDFDPDLLRVEVQRSVDLIPIPRDGLNGADGTSGRDGLNGKDGTRGPRGPRGEAGRQGDSGLIGPMPAHEWEGTKLRFEEAPGEWGKFKDLRGPRGIGGGGSAQVATPALLNSYFPNGW